MKTPLRNRFHILVYHRIGSSSSPDGLIIARGLFREQMRCLRRCYHPMPLGKVVELLYHGGVVPPRTVVVTFDDGYRDTFEAAFPILQRAQIPVTMFVATGYLDGEKSSSQIPMLSWRMVKEMHRAGAEIGSHTVTHPNLAACPPSQLRRELSFSRRRLEQELKVPVTLFAYPYGHARSFNRIIRSQVQRAGYRAACATLPGGNGPGTDPYALRRVSPAKNEIRHLAVQLSELSKGQLPASELQGLQGVDARTSRFWVARYGWLNKRLRREDLLCLPT